MEGNMDIHREEKVQVNKLGDNVVSRQEVVHDVAHERKGLLHRIIQVVWLGTLALEVLLGMRALIKLVAAYPEVPFANFVYSLSEVFLLPFLGLTITPSANGMVLEIPTIIAMLVYAIMGLLAVKLVWALFKPSKNLTVRTYREVDR
jgi:hypothetical protein